MCSPVDNTLTSLATVGSVSALYNNPIGMIAIFQYPLASAPLISEDQSGSATISDITYNGTELDFTWTPASCLANRVLISLWDHRIRQ